MKLTRLAEAAGDLRKESIALNPQGRAIKIVIYVVLITLLVTTVVSSIGLLF